MYGLEQQPKGHFEFDLEKDLHKHPEKAKKILTKIEKEISMVKQQMKEEKSKAAQDHLGKLLQGYHAIETVVKRIAKH